MGDIERLIGKATIDAEQHPVTPLDRLRMFAVVAAVRESYAAAEADYQRMIVGMRELLAGVGTDEAVSMACDIVASWAAKWLLPTDEAGFAVVSYFYELQRIERLRDAHEPAVEAAVYGDKQARPKSRPARARLAVLRHTLREMGLSKVKEYENAQRWVFVHHEANDNYEAALRMQSEGKPMPVGLPKIVSHLSRAVGPYYRVLGAPMRRGRKPDLLGDTAFERANYTRW